MGAGAAAAANKKLPRGEGEGCCNFGLKLWRQQWTVQIPGQAGAESPGIVYCIGVVKCSCGVNTETYMGALAHFIVIHGRSGKRPIISKNLDKKNAKTYRATSHGKIV